MLPRGPLAFSNRDWKEDLLGVRTQATGGSTKDTVITCGVLKTSHPACRTWGDCSSKLCGV
jgi:hypothetical protein